mmetsp:Transcript_15593/g.44375  ORF Transcript_15593/g.44375 Transcript_15593/m.44375 type:complete len:318 (+) Transcript_15593:162-1115(+)
MLFVSTIACRQRVRRGPRILTIRAASASRRCWVVGRCLCGPGSRSRSGIPGRVCLIVLRPLPLAGLLRDKCQSELLPLLLLVLGNKAGDLLLVLCSAHADEHPTALLIVRDLPAEQVLLFLQVGLADHLDGAVHTLNHHVLVERLGGRELGGILGPFDCVLAFLRRLVLDLLLQHIFLLATLLGGPSFLAHFRTQAHSTLMCPELSFLPPVDCILLLECERRSWPRWWQRSLGLLGRRLRRLCAPVCGRVARRRGSLRLRCTRPVHNLARQRLLPPEERVRWRHVIHPQRSLPTIQRLFQILIVQGDDGLSRPRGAL